MAANLHPSFLRKTKKNKRRISRKSNGDSLTHIAVDIGGRRRHPISFCVAAA